MNQIPITQQLIDYAVYEGHLHSSQARTLFFNKYTEIEDKRKRLSSSDFFNSLSKNEKLIYKTNVQLFFIRLFITIITISLFVLVYLKISHLMILPSILVVGLLAFIIDRFISNVIIKNKLVNHIIDHDLNLFMKIMNRTFYNKETNELRFNYQLFDYERSTYDQFIINRPQFFKEITSFKDGELRKKLYYESQSKKLNRKQALEYISLQISLCDLDYIPSSKQNNLYAQQFIDYLKNNYISLEQNDIQ